MANKVMHGSVGIESRSFRLPLDPHRISHSGLQSSHEVRQTRLVGFLIGCNMILPDSSHYLRTSEEGGGSPAEVTQDPKLKAWDRDDLFYRQWPAFTSG